MIFIGEFVNQGKILITNRPLNVHFIFYEARVLGWLLKSGAAEAKTILINLFPYKYSMYEGVDLFW